MLPPLPEPGPDTREFWEGCRRHELRLQRCADCGRARFTPRPGCPWCGALAFDWFTASGRGRVFSWTVVHRPTLPASSRCCRTRPYSWSSTKVRSSSASCGLRHASVAAGIPVRVEWDDVAADVSLPHWRAA